MDTLTRQSTIDLYTLASAHAGLSATSSMGQLLRFEAAAIEAAADQTAALKSRRVSKAMVEHLNTIADLAALVGAHELEKVCLEGLELRGNTKDIGALMGQSLLFSETLERTLVAVQVVFDLCEAMGVAPNGKKLPSDNLGDDTTDTDNISNTPQFEAL